MVARKFKAFVTCYRILRNSGWTRWMAWRGLWWRKWYLLRNG